MSDNAPTLLMCAGKLASFPPLFTAKKLAGASKFDV
jgi:hypothetical protein